MHFLPGYCWKYGAEYFLWCFKPICSGNLIAGPCALYSRFQFAVAWSATHTAHEMHQGGRSCEEQAIQRPKVQGTFHWGPAGRLPVLRASFANKHFLVGDGGAACVSSDLLCLGRGWFLGVVKGWMLIFPPFWNQLSFTGETCLQMMGYD